jgi:hypothetical protein
MRTAIVVVLVFTACAIAGCKSEPPAPQPPKPGAVGPTAPRAAAPLPESERVAMAPLSPSKPVAGAVPQSAVQPRADRPVRPVRAIGNPEMFGSSGDGEMMGLADSSMGAGFTYLVSSGTCGTQDTCRFTCPGGGCRIACESGSTCWGSCAGGGCSQQCASGASCTFVCEGGGCAQACPEGATCASTCHGGDCIGAEP